jgi:hypothetical protein
MPFKSIFLLLALLSPSLWAQTAIAKQGKIAFFSATPLENIEAVSQTAVASLDWKTGAITVKVKNTSFVFPIKLMQDHFNENYMESEKFPVSQFTGQITGWNPSLLVVDQPIKVEVEGVLDVHGVKQNRKIIATLTKKADGSLQASSQFPVKCADHKIDIPTVVVKKIAESVDLSLNLSFKLP